MAETSYLSKQELLEMGFAQLGENILISRFARFYARDKISIGNNVRIDDFCILSGNIVLHDYIHISAGCYLYGASGIELFSFSGLSPGTKVFSASDDFSGNYMVGPMVGEAYTNVKGGKVTFMKYVQIGAGSVIFPALTVHEGASVGAMSLVTRDIPEWQIFAGIPAKFVKTRERKIIDLEKTFTRNNG